jgi:hypothetical protein
MTYEIHEQEPKAKTLGIGRVALDRDGSAMMMTADGKTAMRTLERARVDWMQADGIMISGFEHNGQDKQGKPKYRLQTWFCRYLSNTKGREPRAE